MKTLFRILSYARPIGKYALPFFLFSTLSTLFGLANFTLLIPLLDVLFGNVNQAQEMLQEPSFQWNFEYLKDWFYYYFAYTIQQYGRMGALQFVCIVIVISVFLANLFYYLSMRMRERLKINAILNIREQLFRKITSLHMGYFSTQRKGDLTSRLTTDVQEIENTIKFSLDLLLKEPISLIGFFVALFLISFKLTLFTLIIVPISGATISYVTKKLRKKTKVSQKSIGEILSIVDESITAVRIIKAFNAVAYIREKFNRENQRYARQLDSISRTRELASPFSELSGVAVIAIILIYGGSLVFAENSTLEASEFVTYVILFSQVLRPAKAISNALSYIQRGLSSADRVFEVMDTPTQIQDHPQAKRLASFEKAITFENVSFRYEDKWVLKDINFSIEKGQTVALVGETGSGKSTIADLIPRFYDVQKGKIAIDGISVKDLQRESVLAQMGVVTQESILFNDTIYNNIAFAEKDISPQAIEQAARIANAHDFIMKTENGYQTVIGDRGMKLSGGQRQRITIARAVLKNPPILILDEATSALDVESEKLVQEALYKLMENRTSLVIAHRLSTIRHADKIIVLGNGEIIEEGNHESLLQKQEGVYRRLSQTQSV